MLLLLFFAFNFVRSSFAFEQLLLVSLFGMCALVLTMIYDNKNFIVVLALHVSHTRAMHCNSQTAYFLAVNLLYMFQNEKPIALPLIQNSPSINYINCTLTASRFSDDFPHNLFFVRLFCPHRSLSTPLANFSFYNNIHTYFCVSLFIHSWLFI